MQEWALPWNEDPSEVLAILAASGARMRLETTLAQHPGARHWHFGFQGQAGTLELTWDPTSRRFWFKVASGRRAPWIEPMIQAALRRSSDESSP